MPLDLIGTALVAGLLGASPPENTPPLPTLPRSVEVQLTVGRDGSLSVVEAVSVPAGERMVRTVPLRVPEGDARERVLGVRDVAIEGGSGTAEVRADEFVVELGGGTSIVRYTVDGAVTGEGFPRVHWQPASGWDTALELVRGSLAAPRIADALDCAVEGRPCLAAQVDHAGLTRFSHRSLPAGARMELAVDLPAGTVPATARTEPAPTLAGAFLFTPPVGFAWLGLVAFGLLLAALVGRARRADAAAFTGPVEPGELHGLRPGQAGMLAEGRADAVDLAAAVLAGDAPDPPPAAFAAATRDELVRSGLLRGSRLVRAGVRVVGYGLFLTVLLALTVGYAQLGLVLTAAGATVACAARLLPARTRRGQDAVRGLRALRARVRTDPFAPDLLPWAVTLGGYHRWSRRCTEVADLIGRLAGRER